LYYITNREQAVGQDQHSNFYLPNMTLTMPGVEPVALSLKSELVLKSAGTDVTNDYGTPNLLFLYYIPFLPDDKKLDLEAIQDEFQTWNAWELGQAELQLIGHVEDGSLPSDDSIASRVARNNYRSRVIEIFRAGNEAWYVSHTHPVSSGLKTRDSNWL
jgi:hypothetical protein